MEKQNLSQETSEPVKILFAVLSTYERSGWIHPSILTFFADLSMVPGIASRYVPLHNFSPAAAARNVFCKQFKDADCDWLCMIDNDMKIGMDLLETIRNAPRDAGIVTPVFFMWHQERQALIRCWSTDRTIKQDGRTFGVFEPGFNPINKCGTGVIFIRPWVFDKIAYPYFTYAYNEDGCNIGSEDVQFSEKARQAGIKMYGNGDVRAGHLRSVDLTSLEPYFFPKTLDKEKEASVSSPHSSEASPVSA